MRSAHCITTAALVMALVLTTPFTARAECEVSLTTAVSNRYVLQDLGGVASTRPGFSSDLAYSCPALGGKVTVDWWQRADLDGRGPYGARGYGDEHDLTLTGDFDLGPYKLQASAAYFKLAPLASADGVFKLYADIGRPFDLGDGWSVMPAGRLIQFMGTGSVKGFTTTLWRLPVTMPLDFLRTGVTLTLEPALMANITTPRGQHHTVVRPSADLRVPLTERWSLDLVGTAAGRHKQFELRSTFTF
jgi:hypothetical protein